MAITPYDNSPINRLIIVGNGFDLAHGLPTGYRHFLDDLWDRILGDFVTTFKTYGLIYDYNIVIYGNTVLAFSVIRINIYDKVTYDRKYIELETSINRIINSSASSFDKMKTILRIVSSNNFQNSFSLQIRYSSFFLDIISHKNIANWVDIEKEYYNQLKSFLKNTDRLSELKSVQILNNEFELIKKLLISYLTNNVEDQYENITDSLMNKIFSDLSVNSRDFCENISPLGSITKKHIKQIKILNFNYTSTPKLYTQEENIIYIHGSVLSKLENPVIFGFGDEIDDTYGVIENRDNNEYLKHIKSFQYFHTPNYRNILEFIDSSNFQVYLIGHSCGLSDRVLLNTIFEHEKCKSIKIYYHEKEKGIDDHNDITMNISRHFKNKARMRKVVVNKTYCSPLPQVQLRKKS